LFDKSIRDDSDAFRSLSSTVAQFLKDNTDAKNHLLGKRFKKLNLMGKGCKNLEELLVFAAG